MFMRARAFVLLALMTLLFANGPARAAGADTPGAAGSQVVYPGCPAPANSTGHAYYVDPLRGSPLGNGSQQQPWRTLSDVIAASLFATMPTHYDSTMKMWIHANPNAPIKPGDTVFLMSGDHGSVVLAGDLGKGLVGYNNSQFITIAAYPGQKPVIENLSVLGGVKWVFQGITFQSINNSGTYSTAYNGGKDYFLVSLSRAHSNIVFRNNIFQSQLDTSAWSLKDWQLKRASGILDESGQCIAITGNIVRNIGFGIKSQRSNGVLISGNTIDRFSDDGIDYGSNYMLIQGNRVTNSIEDADGSHRDGMQGQPYTEATSLTNVTIMHNTVIRVTDPTLPYPAQLQGIDEFDGIWNNIAVIDNVVVTDLWNGVAYYGVHNAALSSNIVLLDGGKVLPCANLQLAACAQVGVTYDTSAIPGLVVTAAKNRTPSSGVTVTNNMVTRIGVDLSTIAPLVISGNTCISMNGKCSIGMPVNAKEAWYSTPGTYPGNNVITSVGPAALFVTYDPIDMKYNLTLRPPGAR